MFERFEKFEFRKTAKNQFANDKNDEILKMVSHPK